MPCRAVPNCAAPCRAVPLCVLYRTYQTTTLPGSKQQSWREPACPRAFSTAALYFPVFGRLFFHDCTYRYTSLNREHSKAQHSSRPLHKAANQARVRADQGTYQEKYVRICMRPVCFLEHGALGFRKSPVCTCLHLKCWAIYLTTSSTYHGMSVIPIHSCKRAQRAEPLYL